MFRLTQTLLLLIIALAAYYLFYPGAQVPEWLASPLGLEGPGTENRLALGSKGQAGPIDIPISEPVEFDGLTRVAVLDLRRKAVLEHPELLVGKYRPMTEIFGQIEDGKPWWGIPGQFFHGDGMRSTEGPSEESRFVLNPYLLVAPEFNEWWRGAISEAEVATFPLVCYPRSLTWKPKDSYAEVVYPASCIQRRQRGEFGLIAYNARDLGLDYLYVSYGESENVAKPGAPTTAYANPQFIHRGGSCGFPGGCNNMSPATPEIDFIQLQGLPARITIKLWRKPPASVNEAADMRYVILFR